MRGIWRLLGLSGLLLAGGGQQCSTVGSEDGGQGSACREPDKFTEGLEVKILPNEDVLLNFEFRVTTPSIDTNSFHLFPKSLAQILGKTKNAEGEITVPEVALTIASGTWLPRWGLPPSGIGPQGSEMVAVMHDRSHWRLILEEFTAALCGTFSKMRYELWAPNGLTLTESPLPDGAVAVLAVLPREGLCTNNITPWKKLLPCRAEAGLATLAEALTVFRSKFQSLGLRIASNDNGWTLTQTLSFVVRNPSPPGEKRVGLAELFGRTSEEGIPARCPLAADSTITFATSPPYSFLSQPTVDPLSSVKRDFFDEDAHSWTLKSIDGWPDDLSGFWRTGSQAFDLNEPLGVTAQRFVSTGARMGVAKLVTEIVNRDSEPRGIRVLDLAPRFIKVYYHTLQIALDGQRLELADLLDFRLDPYRETTTSSSERASAAGGGQSRHFELYHVLEAGSSFRIVVQFERQFMHADEFPPDASRGFDLPSSVVGVSNATASEEDGPFLYHVYTEQNPILVPFPDKTMIFNIIAFTGTLYAFTYGLLQKAVFMTAEDLEKSKGGLFQRNAARLCCRTK